MVLDFLIMYNDCKLINDRCEKCYGKGKIFKTKCKVCNGNKVTFFYHFFLLDIKVCLKNLTNLYLNKFSKYYII